MEEARNTKSVPSGLLERRNVKMDTLSPSISGHPVDLDDSDGHPPELDRLSPSLERSTKFKHFDSTKHKKEVKAGGAIKGPQRSVVESRDARTIKAEERRDKATNGAASELTRDDDDILKGLNTSGSRRPRARRSHSDPDPVQYIPDIEVDDVQDPEETQNDNVFKFDKESADSQSQDHSFLFKAASFVLHGPKGTSSSKLRFRNSETDSSYSRLRRPKMFMTKKSKKLVIRLPGGEFLEGKYLCACVAYWARVVLPVCGRWSERKFGLFQNFLCRTHVHVD